MRFDCKKMPDLCVFSQRDALDYVQEAADRNVAIISITNFGADDIVFPEHCRPENILRLRFNNVSGGRANSISESDASSVAEFLKRVVPVVEEIVIECPNGISRSAGVAAAILKYFEGDDGAIINNFIFRPNMTCFMRVLLALYATK